MAPPTFTIDHAARAMLRERHLHLLEGSSCVLDGAATFEAPFAPMAGLATSAPSRFGAFSYSYSILRNVETLGRYCSIADEVTFAPTEHPVSRVSTSSFTYDPGYIWRTFARDVGGDFEPLPLDPCVRSTGISIGHDVWIGTRAYVRGGVRIGDGAIVGGAAVVVKDVPPYAVVVGNPARIVRYRFDDETIAALTGSRWWEYSYRDFAGLPIDRPRAFVEALERRVAAGTIGRYSPEAMDLETTFGEIGVSSERRSG